jgi:MFS family permease
MILDVTPRQAKGDTFESTNAKEDKLQSTEDVVESLGIGWAQILVLLLGAGGIFFVEGLLFGAISSITLSVASDLHLTNTGRSMLSTCGFSGLGAGIWASGWISDIFGRRPVTVFSYAIITVAFLLCAVLHSWTAMCVAGFWAGFGSGFGMPPAIAMLSEVTPVKWRMTMSGAANTFYAIGVVFTLSLATVDDATLEHLNWRNLLLRSAVPHACCTVLAAVFLPESPVFFASKGMRMQAEEGFRIFARRNGKIISGTYAEHSPRRCETLTPTEQAAVIFSPKRWFLTLVTAWGCFCMNLSAFGTAYCQPLIFNETSFMPAAYQNMLTIIAPGIASIAACFFADTVSRKSCVLFSLAVMISCNEATRVAGSVATAHRGWFLESLYQYGAEVSGAGRAVGFVTLHQIAVEIYPSSSSATGGSFVMGVGRIGAGIAPSLFEFLRSTFHTWQSFYICMDVAMAISFLTWMLVPSQRTQESKAQESKASQPVLSAKAGYSTMHSIPVKEV